LESDFYLLCFIVSESKAKLHKALQVLAEFPQL
jgi:hypothetical protein